MQVKLCLLSSVLLLAACGGSKNDIPDPSAAQTLAAETAYNDLRDRKYDAFLEHLDPKLQAHFKDNEKLMKKFSYTIPDGEYKSKTLMVKKIEQPENKPAEFKVSYEIAYPGNLVQYDVSFDQPNGSTQIQNFNIRVYGGSK